MTQTIRSVWSDFFNFYIRFWESTFNWVYGMFISLPILAVYLSLGMIVGSIFQFARSTITHKFKYFTAVLLYALIMAGFVLWRLDWLLEAGAAGSGRAAEELTIGLWIIIIMFVAIAFTIIRGFKAKFGTLLQWVCMFILLFVAGAIEGWVWTLDAVGCLIVVGIFSGLAPIKSLLAGDKS